MNWATLWEQFESVIHSKNVIGDIDTFSHVKTFLKPGTPKKISGLTLSSQNYSEVIDLLKNCYGNPQKLASSNMEQFMNLETVTKSNDEICLKKLLNNGKNSMQNLRCVFKLCIQVITESF